MLNPLGLKSEGCSGSLLPNDCFCLKTESTDHKIRSFNMYSSLCSECAAFSSACPSPTKDICTQEPSLPVPRPLPTTDLSVWLCLCRTSQRKQDYRTHGPPCQLFPPDSAAWRLWPDGPLVRTCPHAFIHLSHHGHRPVPALWLLCPSVTVNTHRQVSAWPCFQPWVCSWERNFSVLVLNPRDPQL